MVCRLCLSKSENYFDLFGVEGLDLEAASIIAEHFWFEPKLDDVTPNSICRNCWKNIDDFHKFYISVKNAHDVCKSLIIKEDPNNIDEYRDNQLEDDNKDNSSGNHEMNWDQLEFDDDIKYGEGDDSCDGKPIKIELKTPVKVSTDMLDEIFKCDKSSNIVEETSPKQKCASKKKRKTKNTRRPKTSKITENKEREKNCNKDQACEVNKRLKAEDESISKCMKLSCNICNIVHENFSSLKKHFTSDHKQKGYVFCCDKKFFRRSLLVDHIQKHLNPDSFKCNHCGKIYTTRFSLRFHISKDHENNIIHKCSHLGCEKIFTRKETLQRHEQLHIPMADRKFKCTQCEKAYISQTSLEYHVRVVHDEVYGGICDICGKTYNNKQNLNRHRIEQHEGGEKPKIQCRNCPEQFISTYHYNIHKFEVHEKPNENFEHKCKYCNKISANSQALKNHIQYMHTSKTKLQCTFCEKVFKRQKALKEHIATHTGQALYVCPHCPKTFTYSANMHHHRKRAHPKEFEEARRNKHEKKGTWCQITAIKQ